MQQKVFGAIERATACTAYRWCARHLWRMCPGLLCCADGVRWLLRYDYNRPRGDFRAGHGHLRLRPRGRLRANATPYELTAEFSLKTSRARIGWRLRLHAGVIRLTTARSRRSPCHSAVGRYRVLAARWKAALAHYMEMKRRLLGLGDIESFYRLPINQCQENLT